MVKKDNIVLYICTECGGKEEIPEEVVKYFDEMDQSNINEPPSFACEACGGVMRPQHYKGIYGKTYKC